MKAHPLNQTHNQWLNRFPTVHLKKGTPEEQGCLCFQAAVGQSGRGVILPGVWSWCFKSKSVFLLTQRDCCIPQASCVQKQLFWIYLAIFDSWTVFAVHLLATNSQEPCSLTGWTFDVITHIQSVNSVHLCMCECDSSDRQISNSTPAVIFRHSRPSLSLLLLFYIKEVES